MAAPLIEKKLEENMSDTNQTADSATTVAASLENETTASTESEESREPSPICTEAAGPDALAGKAKKEMAKARRREDKAIEAVLKALGSLESTEEKLAALCKKYADLLAENRDLQHKCKQSQKSLAVIIKEKDQLQSEHSKAVLAKSKLESLCRELQRHNKLIKEESVARAKEEEEKRKEVTNKFQATINDIQSQMNDHYQKNTKLREENMELASKLKNLIEQYELREKHIEKVFKHKELEAQLGEAKLEQANLQLNETKERSGHEKEALIREAAEAHKRVHQLEDQEKQLRAQVALYTDKYEEFQQTLSKSNDVFQSFKSEMEKMTKKMKKLEKETQMWKSRWEKSNRALLEMAEEKQKSDSQTTQLNAKIAKLESLCRALQEERRKNQRPNGVLPPDTAATGENGVRNRADAEPTKTPPNTPEQSSRSSPTTVQAEPDSTTDKQSPTNTQYGAAEVETIDSDICVQGGLENDSSHAEKASEEIEQLKSESTDEDQTAENVD